MSVRSVLNIRSTILESIKSAFKVRQELISRRSSHSTRFILPCAGPLYGKNTAFSTASLTVPKPRDDALA